MVAIKSSSSKQTHPQKQLDNFYLFKNEVTKVWQKEQFSTVLKRFLLEVSESRKKCTGGSTSQICSMGCKSRNDICNKKNFKDTGFNVHF